MGRHSGHAQPAGPQPGPRGHRGRRKHHPVRTGLLRVSAAMAVGAVAASSGLLSGVTGGLDRVSGGIDGGTATQADGSLPGPAGSDLPSPLGGHHAATYGGGTAPARLRRQLAGHRPSPAPRRPARPPPGRPRPDADPYDRGAHHAGRSRRATSDRAPVAPADHRRGHRGQGRRS